MRVFLVGFMCSGKTTVGRALSRLLGYTFYDTDEEIERKEHLTIPQIFKNKGEKYFRKLELLTLLELSKRRNAVISTGGGLGANPKAVKLMKERGLVVFLKADFRTLSKRCPRDGKRPLLTLGTQKLVKLYNERIKNYKRAHVEINAGGKPEELSRLILQFLKGTPWVGEEGTA
ncbi:MAG: shikimate kinase [Aquificae bacterium]|nr:shikimate kinase [Aquificota bacterium]